MVHRRGVQPDCHVQGRAELDGAVANCALVGDTMANSGAIQLPIIGSTPSQAVLYARGAAVRFSYILIVGQ